MVKFADDTYLIIPASNRGSCDEEKQHVGDWASSNNLRLNHVKSMEIVFCVTEMPTCRGYPSAGGPNYPKGRRNKGAGRNNQQEILGGAARQPSRDV